jgi:hypothetical protein
MLANSGTDVYLSAPLTADGPLCLFCPAAAQRSGAGGQHLACGRLVATAQWRHRRPAIVDPASEAALLVDFVEHSLKIEDGWGLLPQEG